MAELTGTFVVGEPCIGVTDLSCVEVCPVHCIYQVGQSETDPDAPLMVVIDPVECISCGACEPECPVEAIAIDEMVPLSWHPFIDANALITGRGSNDGPAVERRHDYPDVVEAIQNARTVAHAEE